MSVYHYYVGLDSLLIACSTMVVVFATSGRHYWRTWAAPLRFMIMLVLFVLLGIFLGYQTHKYQDTDFPSWIPPSSDATKDSAILLPVSCFLDPDLIYYSSPYATDRKLDGAKLDRIGRAVKTITLPQFWIYCFLCVALTLGFFVNVFESTKHRHQHGKRKRTCVEGLLWAFIFATCFATNVFCAWQIDGLRGWTRRSGWMRDGAEDNMFSIGQLLPLFSLVLILLAGFERLRFKKDEKQVESHGYHRV